MQDKIAKLNEKIDELQKRAEHNAAVIDEKRNAARDQIETELSAARGNIELAKERIHEKAETAKSAAAAEVSRINANIDAAKQKIADKKEAINAKLLANYIEDTIEYADSCIEVATLAIEEAQYALLEAILAQKEYDETYGV